MSPASSPNVTTIGAMDPQDRFAYFNNWGSCVDVNAPGVNILSAGLDNKTGASIRSGSSTAGPHVAGIMATLLSRRSYGQNTPNSNALAQITPLKLKTDLTYIASKDLIDEASLSLNTSNKIVYSGGARANYTEIIERGGWPECCN